MPWGIRTKYNSPSGLESEKLPEGIAQLDLEKAEEQYGRMWKDKLLWGTLECDLGGLETETERVQTSSVARDETVKELHVMLTSFRFVPKGSKEPLKNFKPVLSDLCFLIFNSFLWKFPSLPLFQILSHSFLSLPFF